MPRNYDGEFKNYQSKPAQKADNASRKRARRLAIKLGIIKEGDPRDINHADGNPSNNSPSNLVAESVHGNRSYPRTKNAGKKNPKD